MLRKVLHSKIHRATITGADIDYEGSISLPPELLEAAQMHEFEAVWIWNITNGNRFETYTIEGQSGSGEICVNGAAARLVSPGDLIIIACFTWLQDEELKGYKPQVVFVDSKNQIVGKRQEVPGPKRVSI